MRPDTRSTDGRRRPLETPAPFTAGPPMSRDGTDRVRFSRTFLVILVAFTTLVFVVMVRDFVLTLIVAAIAAGLTQPLYRRLERALGGRRTVAAILSVVLVLLTVVAPLLGLAGVIAGEAAAVAQSAGPWVKERLGSQADLDGYLRRQPFYPRIEPYRRQVLEASGEAASRIGHFLVNGVSAAAKGTVGFLLHLSIMLYALYFFLVGGAGAVEKAISYVPLPAKQMRMLLDKFVSVSGATLKGTLLVGIVQGALAGVGFAAAGIPHSVFWATVTAVLSILPGIGTGLVWVPAAIFLAVTGRLGAGLGLTAWCLVVVGTADNFLRPRLVGRDTEMPDLLILVSTLGGLTLFGAAGFLIGPVVAALFLAVWDLYRAEFRGYLDPAGTNPPIGVDSPGQAG